MITKQDAENFYHGKLLYFLDKTETRVLQCRVSGKVKTWKTRPNDWKIPVKYGLYENAYIGTTMDAEDPARFFLTEKEVLDFLPPKVKAYKEGDTKKNRAALNKLLNK